MKYIVIVGAIITGSIFSLANVVMAKDLAPLQAKVPPVSNSADQLTIFLQRAFLSSNDAVNYNQNIQNLVGQYVIIKNGIPSFLGDHATEPGKASFVKLQNQIPFHLREAETTSLGAKLIAFFSGDAKSDRLVEIVATDVANVTSGDDLTSSTCIDKRPSVVKGNIELAYYCVAAITLSTISYSEYQKIGAIAQGGYGLVTANGSYQLDNSSVGITYKISYSVYGPFKGDHFDEQASVASISSVNGGYPSLVSPGVPTELRGTEAVANNL
jgi:hypothetical protein